ncbi:hypothetical protein CANCADRAFT_114450 [Tortispora caseinolytica NRRL Y-17796]|uniref:Mitochondrial carrier protein n=1 Tax=Tortispora caseinolytica NRRL Y-17796 TaxID=767744 RepID=A0A1E4TGQ4_9ASCO|nr:hypothetical protein CANCADRAFT_114450 [Tortispora caseinolytica NRRL Y-17796]
MTEPDPYRAVKDIFAGTAGGIAQVLSGQPFDTTKVRLQSAPPGRYTGALDVAKQLVKTEGPAAFYKGTLTPLIGVGAAVSTQFGVNEATKRFFFAYNKSQGHDDHRLSSIQFYMCGMAAGLASAFITGPIEQVRIRLQTQSATNPQFKGPLDCMKQIIAASGVKGIFRGITPTLIREGHGMGMYFLAYEACLKEYCYKHNCERKDVSGAWLCGFGAMAGYAMWLSIYPSDVVKSRMQTDALETTKQAYKTTWACTKQLYKEMGVSVFFKGISTTLLRAAPVNAATFLSFEYALRMLD